MASPNFGFTAHEIIKEGRLTINDIQSLKPWLLEENLPRLNDEQIIIFLLCCNNDLEVTKEVIKSFYYWRKKLPNIFNDRTASNERLQAALNVTYMCLISKRTDDNSVILVSRLNDENYRNFNFDLHCKAIFMTADAAVIDYPPDGIILIADAKGAGFMHLTKINFGLLRNLVIYAQNGFQLNIKGIYILNCNYLFDKMIKFIRPFVSQGLFGKIQCFPANMDMKIFYKDYIPQHCLPEDYGGFLPTLQVLHEENARKLVDLEEHFKIEECQRNAISCSNSFV